MADTIKQQIITAITSSLSTITTIKKINYSPARGLYEEQEGDYVNIFDDLGGHETCTKVDLYAKKAFTCSIHLWVKRQNDNLLNDALNQYIGFIEQALLPVGSTLRSSRLCQKFEVTDIDKLSYDENGWGALIMNFDVVYQHVYGNPFQLNP